MKSLYKIWEMDCFLLDADNFQYVRSNVELEFIRITKENYKLVENLKCDSKIESKQLKNANVGFFALYNKKVIGYGWYKDKNSKFHDTFYKMNKADNVCYLCRFFVSEDMRGKNIYPAMISNLIEYHKKENTDAKYYISAYSDNIASIKGLSKVGFKLVSKYKFVRLMKLTVNKIKLV